MIVLINGPFGVGKTTLARELRERIPGSAIYDPERLGYILQHAPQFKRKSDFQDYALWRRGVPMCVAVMLNFYSAVIVPMTIWRSDYLAQITARFARMDDQFKMLCLMAESDALKHRIESRPSQAASQAWALEKMETLHNVFGDAKFGKHIDTTILTPREVCIESLHALGI